MLSLSVQSLDNQYWPVSGPAVGGDLDRGWGDSPIEVSYLEACRTRAGQRGGVAIRGVWSDVGVGTCDPMCLWDIVLGARVCTPWGRGRVRGLRTAKDWVGDGAQGQRRRAHSLTALTQEESPTQACLGWPGFPWRTSEPRTASQALGDAEWGGAFRASGHAPAWLPRTGPVLSGSWGGGTGCVSGALSKALTPPSPASWAQRIWDHLSVLPAFTAPSPSQLMDPRRPFRLTADGGQVAWPSPKTPCCLQQTPGVLGPVQVGGDGLGTTGPTSSGSLLGSAIFPSHCRVFAWPRTPLSFCFHLLQCRQWGDLALAREPVKGAAEQAQLGAAQGWLCPRPAYGSSKWYSRGPAPLLPGFPVSLVASPPPTSGSNLNLKSHCSSPPPPSTSSVDSAPEMHSWSLTWLCQPWSSELELL